MKHLLALMTLFLILMLTITTVMAIGNVKQSQQMTQRVQLISSLRADLRSAEQKQETLTNQLESERAASRSLRTERNALTKRYDRLMALLHSQPVGYTDMLPTSGGWTSPRILPLPGENWLQAQALQQLLTEWQVAQEEGSAAAEAVTAVAETIANIASVTAETAGETITKPAAEPFNPVTTASAATTTGKEATQTAATTPPAAYAEAVSATAGQTLQEAMDAITATGNGSIFSVVSTPEGGQAPAATAAPTAAATLPITATPPKATPAIPSPAPHSPSPVSPIATATITTPPVTTPAPQPTPSLPPQSGFQSALISGLSALRQWLHQADAAIGRAITHLQQHP